MDTNALIKVGARAASIMQSGRRSKRSEIGAGTAMPHPPPGTRTRRGVCRGDSLETLCTGLLKYRVKSASCALARPLNGCRMGWRNGRRTHLVTVHQATDPVSPANERADFDGINDYREYSP